MIDVVCGVIKNGDKYLITQRGDEKNYGKWEFPGGKVKENEHPFDSIKREIKEELNIEISPLSEIRRYKFKGFNLIFIKCEILEPNQEIDLNEHLDYKWIETNQFMSYEFIEGDVKFIKYLEKN
jgi:8-oxo-dGTP diphosphatase